jgi:peptide/nickel transport system permease protein
MHVGLRSYILKRLVYSFVLVVLIIMLNFAIFKMMPGDPIQFLTRPFQGKISPEEIQAQQNLLREIWGFGDPFHIQLAKYMRNLLTWNFGISIVGKTPIAELMARRIPYTLLLLGSATALSIVFGVLLGVAVIQRRGTIWDSCAVTSSLILGSLPTFWLGLVFLVVFFGFLQWFPNAGAFPRTWALGWPQALSSTSKSSPNALSIAFSFDIGQAWTLVGGYLYHLFLPLLTLTIFSFGSWLLLTRATMLDTIAEDYIVTARAKGLTERSVLYRHALKNASLPLITSAALSFGFILSGAIITETVFTYPGLGGWIWESIQTLDYQVLMAVFYVISICVVVANIVADILYGIIDPRIKYG